MCVQIPFGMWQTRIFEAISLSGTAFGVCLGLPGCQYGKDLNEANLESDALLALLVNPHTNALTYSI